MIRLLFLAALAFAAASQVEKFTPVTDKTLLNPSPEDWLIGKQYVAVMTGDNPKVPELLGVVPELDLPRGHNEIYVFRLP